MKIIKLNFFKKADLIDQLLVERDRQLKFILFGVFLLLIPIGFLFINSKITLMLDEPIPTAIALCIPALISIATALNIETKIDILKREIKK